MHKAGRGHQLELQRLQHQVFDAPRQPPRDATAAAAHAEADAATPMTGSSTGDPCPPMPGYAAAVAAAGAAAAATTAAAVHSGHEEAPLAAEDCGSSCPENRVLRDQFESRPRLNGIPMTGEVGRVLLSAPVCVRGAYPEVPAVLEIARNEGRGYGTCADV